MSVRPALPGLVPGYANTHTHTHTHSVWTTPLVISSHARRTLGRVDLRFSFRGPENRLVGPVGDESQFEVRVCVRACVYARVRALIRALISRELKCVAESTS